MRLPLRRSLTLALAALTISTALPTATATADNDTDRDFLGALASAGIGDGRINGVDTVALGQSVCPLLVEPGKSFASAVSRVRNDGVPPEVAAFFVGIAVQMYCPQMLSSIGDGSLLRELRNRPGSVLGRF